MFSVLFALRTLSSHGLSTQLLQLVSLRSSVLSKLTYASPSFVGFLSNSTIDQLQSFIRRAVKFGYYRPSDPDISTIINISESALFFSITTNPSHVLAPLLPPLKSSVYNLWIPNPLPHTTPQRRSKLYVQNVVQEHLLITILFSLTYYCNSLHFVRLN